MPYQFRKDEKVKFKTWSDYTSRELHPWTWLVVLAVDGDFVRVRPHEKPDVELTVPSKELDVPLGFQEIYTIEVESAAKAKSVWSWMKDRGGIAVFTSLDLSTAGRMNYFPATTEDGLPVTPEMKPHWSMGYVETVTDPKRIKIVVCEVAPAKPKDARKNGWTYDRHRGDYYRYVPWTPETV